MLRGADWGAAAGSRAKVLLHQKATASHHRGGKGSVRQGSWPARANVDAWLCYKAAFGAADGDGEEAGGTRPQPRTPSHSLPGLFSIAFPAPRASWSSGDLGQPEPLPLS